VLGKASSDVVSDVLGEAERGLVEGIDLQPDAGNAEGVVCPRGDRGYGPRGDAAASFLGPDPVRQLDASGDVRDQADSAEQALSAQDPGRELSARCRVPL
jgi:hypothetical protein